MRDAWQQHLSGRYDWTARLWGGVMFQAWVEQLPAVDLTTTDAGDGAADVDRTKDRMQWRVR